MLKWLGNKLAKSRYVMCAKELKWALQGMTERERAELLALAAKLKEEFIRIGEGSGDFPEGIIDYPQGHEKADLERLYWNLENLRNNQKMQLTHQKKQTKKFGMSMPAELEKQAEMAYRAIELWMITVGSPVSDGCYESAREVWQMLADCRDQLPAAIEAIQARERAIMEVTGSMLDSAFQGEDPELWAKAASRIPEGF